MTFNPSKRLDMSFTEKEITYLQSGTHDGR
jgi:hypothetical protein